MVPSLTGINQKSSMRLWANEPDLVDSEVHPSADATVRIPLHDFGIND